MIFVAFSDMSLVIICVNELEIRTNAAVQVAIVEQSLRNPADLDGVDGWTWPAPARR